jgi:hypothetical protein
LNSFIFCIKTGPGGGKKREDSDNDSLSPIIFNAYSDYFTKESLEGFGDFEIGQGMRTVNRADDLLLLAKEEAVLRGMIERLTAIGGPCGVEMNVERD